MEGRPVRSRPRRWGLRALVGVAITVVILGALSTVSATGLNVDVIGTMGVLGFTAVGAFILDRRPGEPVGRICLGVGMVYGLAGIFRLGLAFVDGLPGPLPPVGAALASIGSTLSSLALLLSGPLLISRFPTRVTATWQRRLEDVLMVAVGLIVAAGALRPGPLDFDMIEPVLNPLGVGWIPVDTDVMFAVTALTYGAAYLVTSVGLVRRYRVGGSVVRAQIRWFAAAIAISMALFVVLVASTGYEALNGIAWALWIVSLLLPPIAIAIAIVRYRLYDIDRIVSKTIGYGLVTVILFGVFATANIVLVSNVSPLVEDESIAVAASTLLVAVLFDPLRKRVQAAVDRRFHRAHYDAQRMVGEFADRLRNELDLPTLTLELAAVADSAVKPATTSLWLRGGPP